MTTEIKTHVCDLCLINIENDYERHIWHETCRLNGLYKVDFTIYLDDETFESHLQYLEKKNYIKYRNLDAKKVVVKALGAQHSSNRIIYCISPKEHLCRSHE